jgi:hypothetical protein
MCVAIGGNTYAVKDQLRALGGRWDAARKVWLVPDDRAEEAALLLFPASSPTEAVRLATSVPASRSARRGPRTCRTCGQRINYGVYCGKCEFGGR